MSFRSTYTAIGTRSHSLTPNRRRPINPRPDRRPSLGQSSPPLARKIRKACNVRTTTIASTIADLFSDGFPSTAPPVIALLADRASAPTIPVDLPGSISGTTSVWNDGPAHHRPPCRASCHLVSTLKPIQMQRAMTLGPHCNKRPVPFHERVNGHSSTLAMSMERGRPPTSGRVTLGERSSDSHHRVAASGTEPPTSMSAPTGQSWTASGRSEIYSRLNRFCHHRIGSLTHLEYFDFFHLSAHPIPPEQGMSCTPDLLWFTIHRCILPHRGT